MSNDRVIERVRKLLALSGSDNEHEAAAAAHRAQVLLAEHQLTMAELDAGDSDDGPEVVRETWFNSKRIPGWRSRLAFGVAAGFGCEATRSAGWGMRIYGDPSAVATARATFAYLVQAIERCAREARRAYQGMESPRSYASAYRLGMADRLSARLRQRRSEAMAEAAEAVGASVDTVAMVRVTQEQAIRAMVDGFAKGRRWQGPVCSSRRGYANGYDDGGGVGLDAQLSGAAE